MSTCSVICISTVFTCVIFANFLVKTGVQKLCEAFLEGVVLEVTFRLVPELGILFISLKHFSVIIKA
jgi:hypothetical protein